MTLELAQFVYEHKILKQLFWLFSSSEVCFSKQGYKTRIRTETQGYQTRIRTETQGCKTLNCVTQFSVSEHGLNWFSQV